VKKLLITLLKVFASLAIIGYLFYAALRSPEGREELFAMLKQPAQWHWGLIALSLVASAAGILITLVRWCYLVRAVGIQLSMKDAMRIGLLGYFVNLLPMGIVGGDLLKAVMLAHEHPGFRAKSAASVIIDRVVGLYVLFVVASAGILLTGFYWNANLPDVRFICQVTLGATVVGAVGISIVLFTPVLDGRLVGAMTRLPRIGHAFASLIDAMRIYRRDLSVLALSAALSVGVHCLLTISVYLLARGLPGNVIPVPLGMHFVIYPISSVASTIPLPMGPFEGTLVFLYTHADPAWKIRVPSALIVALLFRLIAVLLAVVGFVYYLRSRREMAEVMHEVEEEEKEGQSPWGEIAADSPGK